MVDGGIEHAGEYTSVSPSGVVDPLYVREIRPLLRVTRPPSSMQVATPML